jgi:lipoprotein NlpD
MKLSLSLRELAMACAALLLGGCIVAKQPAPVVERVPEAARQAKAKPGTVAPEAAAATNDPRPQTYTVKRGDTLYGIALDHGQDYRDVARWNNLSDPNVIEVGQVLWVRDPATAKLATAAADAAPPASAPTSGATADGAPTGGAVTTPYQAAPVAPGREVGSPTAKPLTEDKPAGAAPAAEAAQEAGVVSSPKAVKLPYSDAALAKLRAEAAPAAAAAEAPAAKPDTAAKPEAAAGDDPDGLVWAWPTKGKVVAGFNENGGPKGLQIAGEMGQPVLASAGGRVVYTGSGLRGYGNLVIIKHNNTYLSAYAHNRSILVKQGDNVTKGQKIAEMGNSDASRVMLHFEIRRLGKPVDPIKFLPPT